MGQKLASVSFSFREMPSTIIIAVAVFGPSIRVASV